MPSIGKPVPHDSAVGHVTGQARFIDDLPALAGELSVGFVGSPVAAGKLVRTDVSAALAVPGRGTYRHCPGPDPGRVRAGLPNAGSRDQRP